MRRYFYRRRFISSRREVNARQQPAAQEAGNVEMPEWNITKLRQHVGVLFVVFLTGVFYAVGSISDPDLVRLKNPIDFPLGLVMSPETFAQIVPPTILIFHFIVLSFADARAVKWHVWLREQSSVVKAIVFFIVFFMPMLALLCILFRFSDLHNLPLSVFHFLVFILDAVMILYFYTGIVFPASRKKNERYNKLMLMGSLLKIYAVSAFVKKRKLSGIRLSWNRAASQMLFVMLILAACFNLIVVKLITDDNRYKSIAAYMKGDSIGTIIRLLYDSDYHCTYDARLDADLDYLLPIPVLNIEGRTVTDSTLIVREVAVAGLPFGNDSLHIKHATAIDLPYRDFTFARFTGCIFNNANLICARMMSARLSSSKFSNALLISARLENAIATNTDFENAVFDWATFTGTDLRHANLRGARLDNVELGRADLQCSDLTRARIRRSELSGNVLTCVNLKNVNFEGSHLVSIDLAAVDLDSVNMKGAILMGVDFQGATLRNADLRGATFLLTKLQGADLSGAKLQGALLEQTFVNSVNWPQDISQSTAFALGGTFLSHFPSEEEIKKKDMFFRSLHNGKSNYEQKMKQAKKEFEPKFGYKPGEDLASGQFIKERIELLYDRHIPIVHLLLRKHSIMPYLDVNTISKFNKALMEYCFTNHPRRINELKIYRHRHGDFPGAELNITL